MCFWSRFIANKSQHVLYVLNSVIPQLLVFNFYIKVESVLRQGSVLLTWSSLLLDKFFKNADEALFELKDLVKKVCY